MEDISFNSYKKLGNVDPNLTCISYVDNVVFFGNSYGDIKLIYEKKTQILHNHSGEITALISKRCCKLANDDVVYLFAGTSIGNVYLHLVFLKRITDSRILYKFSTGFAVYSICLHPDFKIHNFKRLSKRLTVDFSEEIYISFDDWSNLQNSTISSESFIVSLSNGNIYLVYNSSSAIADSVEFKNEFIATNQLENEKYVIAYVSSFSPYVNMRMNWYKNYISWMDKNGFNIYLLPNFESIVYISNKFLNLTNSNKNNENKNENVNRAENGNGVENGHEFEEEYDSEGRRKHINYLTDILDNNELYGSTDESDIFSEANSVESTLSFTTDKVSSVSNNIELLDLSSIYSPNSASNRSYRFDARSVMSSTSKMSSFAESGEFSLTGTPASDLKPANRLKMLMSRSRSRESKYRLKRLNSRRENLKFTRDNSHYGIMSNFISDSILVGFNNILFCVKLINSSQLKFKSHQNLLLSTNQNKEDKNYIKSNITKNKRSNNIVRGYIEYKFILPKDFSIRNIIYNSRRQFDVIALDSSNNGPSLSSANLNKSRRGYVCYRYNRNGSVYKYKMGGHSSYRSLKDEDLLNVIFDLNDDSVYCESIMSDGYIGSSCNIIVGTSTMAADEAASNSSLNRSDPMNYMQRALSSMVSRARHNFMSSRANLLASDDASSLALTPTSAPATKHGVYVYAYNTLINIGCIDNYLTQLKFYIDTYDTESVIEHFKNGLSSLLNTTRIGSVEAVVGSVVESTPMSGIYGFYETDLNEAESEVADANLVDAPRAEPADLAPVGAEDTKEDANKTRRYLLEYIRMIVDYLFKIQSYSGFKMIIQLLSNYGILSQYIDLIFTREVINKMDELDYYDELVTDIMDIVGDDTLIYFKLLSWDMGEQTENLLLNRIKKFLARHIHQLYQGFQMVNLANSQASGAVDGSSSDDGHEIGGVEKNGNCLSNETYFHLLLLLNELNKSDVTNAYKIYNLLCKFFRLTAAPSTNNAASYSNTHHIESYKQFSTTNLRYYVKLSEHLQTELLSLKYYYKALNERLADINTRGTVYYSVYNKSTITDRLNVLNDEKEASSSAPEAPRIRYSNGRVVKRNAVDCNICSLAEHEYERILGKLLNRVIDSPLRPPRGRSILYFGCSHLVHEACQVRLINQLHRDTVALASLRMSVVSASRLLGTCLSCLSI